MIVATGRGDILAEAISFCILVRLMWSLSWRGPSLFPFLAIRVYLVVVRDLWLRPYDATGTIIATGQGALLAKSVFSLFFRKGR